MGEVGNFSGSRTIAEMGGLSLVTAVSCLSCSILVVVIPKTEVPPNVARFFVYIPATGLHFPSFPRHLPVGRSKIHPFVTQGNLNRIISDHSSPTAPHFPVKGFNFCCACPDDLSQDSDWTGRGLVTQRRRGRRRFAVPTFKSLTNFNVRGFPPSPRPIPSPRPPET